MHAEVSCTYSTHTHIFIDIYLYLYLVGAHLVGSSIIFYPWRLFSNSPESLGHHHARQELVTAPSANSLLQYREPQGEGRRRRGEMIPLGKGGSRFFEAIFLHDHCIYIGVLFFVMSNMLYFGPLGERTKHDSIWQTSFRWLASPVNISRRTTKGKFVAVRC